MKRELSLLQELGCALTQDELEEQRGRARSLAGHVAEARRDGDVLTLCFDEGADDAVLRTLLETEQRCCPFFRIEHDPLERRVAISVAREADRPALEAVAALFVGSA